MSVTATKRQPLYFPLCGDIWLLSDGRKFVVDYHDPFSTGLTFDDGEQIGFRYTQTMAEFITRNSGALISAFEDAPLSWNCDERGWTRDPKSQIPDVDQSVSFINRIVKK
jgi:hypothetical protein